MPKQTLASRDGTDMIIGSMIYRLRCVIIIREDDIPIESSEDETTPTDIPDAQK